MTMKDRMEKGLLFTDMCEGLPEERARAKKLQYLFNHSDPEKEEDRMCILGEILGTEPMAWVEPPFHFCYGRNIKLGKNCYINVNCNFIDDGEIRIGDRVMFGPAVTIATVGHPIDPDLRGYMYCDPVTIGDNCWIGAGAVICPGVTIGENSVIGAGSVVTGNIPANVVAAGNPCRVIRQINASDKQFYYKDRPITAADLVEEQYLRNAGV